MIIRQGNLKEKKTNAEVINYMEEERQTQTEVERGEKYQEC